MLEHSAIVLLHHKKMVWKFGQSYFSAKDKQLYCSLKMFLQLLSSFPIKFNVCFLQNFKESNAQQAIYLFLYPHSEKKSIKMPLVKLAFISENEFHILNLKLD